MGEKKQARAPAPWPMGPQAFGPQEGTTVYWLANSGALVNCRGTVLLIDPLLTGFDMPLLVEAPLQVEDVPKADAVLLTHSDNDHFSGTPAGTYSRCAGPTTPPGMWRDSAGSWA